MSDAKIIGCLREIANILEDLYAHIGITSGSVDALRLMIEEAERSASNESN